MERNVAGSNHAGKKNLGVLPPECHHHRHLFVEVVRKLYSKVWQSRTGAGTLEAYTALKTKLDLRVHFNVHSSL